MKPGDLVVANPKFSSFIRIYSDPECSMWEDQLQNQVGVVLGTHKNLHRQDIVGILLPRGVRWVYRIDVVLA